MVDPVSLLWLLLPTVGVFLVGYALGYAHGAERGSHDAYRRVARWSERRGR